MDSDKLSGSIDRLADALFAIASKMSQDRPLSNGDTSIDVLDLTTRGRNCLLDNGIRTIAHLRATSDRELDSYRHLGKTTRRHISRLMVEYDRGERQ